MLPVHMHCVSWRNSLWRSHDPWHWVIHINLCVTSTVCWSYVSEYLIDGYLSILLCLVQGDPGFPQKNDEDNCFIREENVYQQIGNRKNRGALLMWFRVRLGTSHKMDSFALQKYMGWIARRFNGKSARHYFQPCFTYSLLFVKRPLRHSMARCQVCWRCCRGDRKSFLQLCEASGDKGSPAVHVGREDAVNPKGWQMRQHWQGFIECWKAPHQTASTWTKSSCRMKRWKIVGCSQRWKIQNFCKKNSLPEKKKKNKM